MKIINKRKIFFTVSGLIILISVLVWIAWGLNLGIDFTGGSLLEVEYVGDRSSPEAVKNILADLDLEGLNIQPTDDKGYILRFKEIDEETHQQILERLNKVEGAEDINKENSKKDINVENIAGKEGVDVANVGFETASQDRVIENRFEAIGPAIGQELKSKSIWAIIIVLIAIVAYIAWAFRKVSYPITSWKYGVVAIITLFHDVLITLGIFIFLGRYLGLEVNTPFVAALLTILGYSVNDTIVVFDRIRENLHKYEGEFEEIVDKSVRETVTRSINTSLTTELVLLSILFFGGATIREFVLVLAIGILLGTYSSIFTASPLLVVWQKLDWRLKKS